MINIPELILVLHLYCIVVHHPFYSLAEQYRHPHMTAVPNNVNTIYSVVFLMYK